MSISLAIDMTLVCTLGSLPVHLRCRSSYLLEMYSLWIELSRKPRIVRIDLEMVELFNLLSEI